MKNLSTNYKNHVALPSSTLATIIKIVRKDATTYRYTDHDQAIDFGGETYSPLNSFVPTEFQTSATLAVDNLDITGIINNAEGINESDIHKEFFYDAKIYVSQVNYTDPDGTGQNKILFGSLGELSLQENKYIVEFRSLTYPLTRKLANVFSKTCRVEFGSAECGIAVDPGYWLANTEYCIGDAVQSRIYDGKRYTVTVGGTSGNSGGDTYAEYIRSDTNLANQWSLDEDSNAASVKTLLHMNGADASTTFTDEVGKTFTAYNQAQIDTARSVFGGASGYFDGTGDYIDTPNHTDFDISSGDYTFECWIYITAWPGVGAWSAIFAQHSGSTGYRLLYDDDARLHFSTDAGAANGFTTPNGSISLNTWHHVAAVGESGDSHCYIDGVKQTGSGLSHAITHNTTTFKIGSTDGSNWFHTGWIDEFRFTKGVARYTADFTVPGAPFTLSTVAEDTEGTDDGTFTNSPTLGAEALIMGGGPSVSFDSTSSNYISVTAAASINNLFSAGGKTIECWIKPTGVNGDSANSGWIMSKDDASGVYNNGRQGWGLQYFGDSGYISFFQRFDDGVSAVSYGVWTTTSSSIMDNQIYHVVVTYNGSSTSNIPEIWLNGIKQSLITAASPTGGHTAADDSTAPLVIGSCDPVTNTRYFDGNIDEVAIYSSVLADSEIQNHYIYGTYGLIEPAWNQTIDGTTTDNEITWTTGDGYKKEATILAPIHIRLKFHEPNGPSTFYLNEIEFYDMNGTRVLADSVAGGQYIIGSYAYETNGYPGENWHITNGEDEAIITFTFLNPFALSHIDITGIGPTNGYFESLEVEVSYDNEVTWEEIYSFTGGTAFYFAGIGMEMNITRSDINCPSRAKILVDDTTFSNMTWLVDGLVTWVDGGNSDLSIEVSGYNTTTDEIYLFSPMPEEIKFGDNITILSGCNHLYLGHDGTVATGHCETRYGNGVNFRGEPFVPTEDVLVGGIGETNKEPIVN